MKKFHEKLLNHQADASWWFSSIKVDGVEYVQSIQPAIKATFDLRALFERKA